MLSVPERGKEIQQIQLLDIKQVIKQMGEKTVLMLAASVQAVVRKDLKAAADARQYEKEVDILYRTVDALCVNYIAISEKPVADDIYLLVATLKISSELERIADYGNNIAKLAQNTFPYLDLSSLEPLFATLEQMAEKAIGMVKDALKAYEDNDEKLAQSVLERDQTVNALNKALFKGILASVTVRPWTQEASLDFHVVVRYWERVADRSTNIAEWVFYVNSGRHYTTAN